MDCFEIRNDKAVYNGIEYDFDKLPENVVFDGDIDISCKDLSRLPNISSWVNKGGFYCSGNYLSSLKGCPKEVNNFQCSNSNLTSLEHCPIKIYGNFQCHGNKLTSLKHCPEKVGGCFSCGCNKLTSLEHCPKKIIDSFYCSNNHITSLKHCPEEIGGCFDCSYNNLKSLDSWPENIDNGFSIYGNPIETIQKNKMSLKYLIYFYKKGWYNSKELLMEEFGVNTEEELNAYLIMMEKI